MIFKIQNYHKEKIAYIYLRQSTMGQVLHHQESTERQYALKNKALEYGWPKENVKVLDGDLGLSGTQMTNRNDFKMLVADVSMKVGAVFALEASRLSRSSTDWHRLLELCSLTKTLIIDEDGCYDLADFNDQLLLGLKGTMSQAELHFIRARLHGGKLNKAKKGQLRFPLPVGLCYDDQGNIIQDPDDQVRNTVKLLFAFFKEKGSAYGIVRKFGLLNIKFPKRAYGGVWNGKLIWGRLTYARTLSILKNPCYAGAYVFGRFKHQKKLLTDGTIFSKIEPVPMDSWQVLIKNHHEGYITWEEFSHNKTVLQQNLTCGVETMMSSPPREGEALLQGTLLCGTCGRRMTVRYTGHNGIYPKYECNWRKREGLTGKACLSIRCDIIDQAISTRLLQVMKPAQIEIAIKAMEEIERRDAATDNHWHMQIERTDYETQLAQKRYEEVDPSNRLVAATLEKRWNDALVKLEQVKQQAQEYQQKQKVIITPEQKEKIFNLAQDLPRLWYSPTTKAKDRKRMVRLLINDITLEKLLESNKIILHIRWQGGACEDMDIDSPPKMYDKLRYSPEIVSKIRSLAKSLVDRQIVEILNNQGILSAKGKPFTVSMIKWIRYKHSIPLPALKNSDELTIKELTEKLGVTNHVVYYWIEQGYVKARKINEGSPYWIKMDPAKEHELKIYKTKKRTS